MKTISQFNKKRGRARLVENLDSCAERRAPRAAQRARERRVAARGFRPIDCSAMCSSSRPPIDTAPPSQALEVSAGCELLPRRAPEGGRAAWLRVCAAAFAFSGTVGIQYAFSLLYGELLAEFDAREEEIALIGSLALTVVMASAPATGAIIGRFGARRTCATGGVLAALGLCASAAATRPWHLYVTFGLVTGLGHSFSSIAPVFVLSAWFDKRFALAMGIANTGTAFAPLVLGPAAPAIFAAVGWRSALLGLALIDGCLLCGASLVLTPPGASSGRAPAKPPHTLAMLLRLLCRREVLGVAATLFVYGLGVWVPIEYMVRLGLERGLSKEHASQLLVFLALGNATMRIPAGAAADRFGRLETFGVLVLAYSAVDLYCGSVSPAEGSSHAFLMWFAYFCGGLTGGCNVLTNALPMDLMPKEEAVQSLMLCLPFFGLGVLIGPVAAGSVVEASGSLTLAVRAAGFLLLFAAVGSYGLKRRQSTIRAGESRAGLETRTATSCGE